jgi:hypothetical protein
LWEKSLAGTLDKHRNEAESENESICVDYEHMVAACKTDVQTKGYHLASKTITEKDSDQLAEICHKLFDSRDNNSEHTHFSTGTKRLSLFMTRQHFSDLAEQSYEEHTTNKAKSDPPYEFVEHLVVWNDELTADEVDCVLRVMRAKSKCAGAMWQQEFELVKTGTNDDTSPQMWHFDGTHANLAAVCVLPSGGGDGRTAVRGSTEFVQYPHECLSKFPTEKEKLSYLESIWSKVTRTTVTTQSQYDKTVRQDEVKEELSTGSIIECWKVKCGDSTFFLSTHMHRGAGSFKTGYACFSAWEVPECKHTDTHTDGTPVHKTNWKLLYTKLFAEERDSQKQVTTTTNNAQRADRVASRNSANSYDAPATMHLVHKPRFRGIDCWSIKPMLPNSTPQCITKFESFWVRTFPELTTSGKHMYGEANAGSLWKIWAVIDHTVGIREDDVVGDWGNGGGKMILSKQFMCPFPDIPARGMEIDPNVFKRCQSNVELLGPMLTNTRHFLGNSASIQNWAPVTIMLQYDGPTAIYLQEDHLTIMRAIFRTATVRCVFSTKLNKSCFVDYFTRTREDEATLTAWRVVTIHGLVFGKSKYKGYLWIRNSTEIGTATRNIPAEGPRDERFCL